MRTLVRATLVGAVVAALAPAAHSGEPKVDSRQEAYLFASGGTPLSNGIFYPGTVLCGGGSCDGVPYQIEQGTDITFVNTDVDAVANSHGVSSFKRRKKNGRPLFLAPPIAGPGTTLLVTHHLKPGVYRYFCPTHGGMLGAIEVVPRGAGTTT